MSLGELDLEAQNFLDLRRQTGGPVVEPSLDAVIDVNAFVLLSTAHSIAPSFAREPYRANSTFLAVSELSPSSLTM